MFNNLELLAIIFDTEFKIFYSKSQVMYKEMGNMSSKMNVFILEIKQTSTIQEKRKKCQLNSDVLMFYLDTGQVLSWSFCNTDDGAQSSVQKFCHTISRKDRFLNSCLAEHKGYISSTIDFHYNYYFSVIRSLFQKYPLYNHLGNKSLLD